MIRLRRKLRKMRLMMREVVKVVNADKVNNVVAGEVEEEADEEGVDRQ